MYDPLGNKLFIDDICKDDKLIIKENILTKLNETNIDIDSALYFTKQEINIFNLSSSFYTDICYHFDSPINKDITLKDRIKLFFPNITLCEDGCFIKGINYIKLESICECTLNNIMNNGFFENNMFIQTKEIQELISQTNINIIKCYNDILNFEYYKSNIGAFIILFLIIIEIIITIIYSLNSLYSIRKYIFAITEKYVLYLTNNKNQIKEEKENKFLEPKKA